MVNLKKKEPVVLALSPRVAVGDDSLPRVIGGRCEFTGKVFNDRDECPSLELSEDDVNLLEKYSMIVMSVHGLTDFATMTKEKNYQTLGQET